MKTVLLPALSTLALGVLVLNAFPEVLDCGGAPVSKQTTAVAFGSGAADSEEAALTAAKNMIKASAAAYSGADCAFQCELPSQPPVSTQCPMRIVLDFEPGGAVTCTTVPGPVAGWWQATCTMPAGSWVTVRCQTCP